MSESQHNQPAGPQPDQRQADAHPAPPPKPGPLYPDLPTGTGLGKYRILERTGTSHNAIVYRARDAMLDRLVAIKQMSPDLFDSPVACGLFKREAQFMARIPRGSRSIVGIHELIEDDLGLFIVEEFVSGPRLDSLIAKRQVDPSRAVRFLKSIAQGLRTLHDLGIVHRGIHPGNIVITKSGHAKIANFACAAHESDTSPPPVIIPKYAAPELLLGKRYDSRVDLYSLGMVMFEMCAGRAALNRHSLYKFSDPSSSIAHWTEWQLDQASALPDASGLDPRIPPRLAEIIRRMTAKNLEVRFASPQEILDAASLLAPDSSGRGQRPVAGLPSLPLGINAVDALSQRPRVQPEARETLAHGLNPLAKQPVTRTIRLVKASRVTIPALGVSQAAPAGAPAELYRPTKRVPQSALPTLPPYRRRRRRISPASPARRPPRIEMVPTPQPVIETQKQRHPHLLAWTVAAALLFVGICLGGGILYRHYSSPGPPHPIEAVMAEGVAAYENDQLQAARDRLTEAASMEVDMNRFRHVKNQAALMLILVDAASALEDSDFDQADAKLREAQRRGANPSMVDDLQERIWNRKDAYRLAAKGIAEMDRGNLRAAEVTLDAYDEKARAGGLDPAPLKQRLGQSKEDQRYSRAVDRVRIALEQEDFEAAMRACLDAEGVKATTEVRDLRKLVFDRKRRAEWILKGDDAMRGRDFAEAASAYGKANRIEASDETEVRARIAAAYQLYGDALACIERGELLDAERNLRSSLWKFPTDACRVTTEKMRPAFAAARLVKKGDRALEAGDEAEAKRLYQEALPSLPPPADETVETKLANLQNVNAGDRENGSSTPRE